MHTSESTRFRLKFHTGAEIETRYQLMGYGIPVDQIPITTSGKIKSGVQQWINTRTLIENQKTEDGAIVLEDIKTNIIECPNFNDVAIRPGKSYLCHPGNVKFKELLAKRMDDHASANRKGKDIISWGIIEEIECMNGRFLEWDNIGGYWVENKDRNSIRAKIPVYFRDHKRNTKAKRKQLRQKTVSNITLLPSFDNDGSIDPLKSYVKKRKVMMNEGAECKTRCLPHVF